MRKDKGKEERKRRLIPEGELKCVWMEAGVVAYKLCDSEYECEKCPFDQVLRKGSEETVARDRSPGEDSDVQPTPSGQEDSRELRMGFAGVKFNTMFQQFCGVTIRGDRLYHPGHTWVEVERSNSVRMGLDDFAGKFLLGIKMVILPTVRSRIDRGQVCCWILEEDGTLPIMAPLSGSVRALNRRLSQEPNLVTRSPYEEGWLMKVEPENLAGDVRFLCNEDEFSTKCTRDAEKVRARFESLLKDNWENVGPTLCDGGNTLVHVRDMLGPKRYFDLISVLFSGT